MRAEKERAVIVPTEGHFLAVKTEQAMVADNGAMGIAREVVQN